MAQPIEDEYGIVTENARRRSVFSKYIERRVEDYLTSPGGRARLAREIESRVKVEVDALIARKAQERVAELERATNVPRGPEIKVILETVSAVTGTSVADILGPRRARNCAWPRHFATYVLREARKDLSLPAIARALNRADHTTCLAALRRFDLIRDTYPVADWLADERTIELLKHVVPTEERIFLRTLTPQQAADIRNDTRPNRAIADAFGISKSQVDRIKRGDAWKEAS